MGEDYVPCSNCDGRKCTACCLREVHDECVDDCPECCGTPIPEIDDYIYGERT